MELPRIQPLYEKYKDQGFQIVTIDGLNMTEEALKFIEENELTFTFLETGEGEENVVRNVFGVRSYPSTFIIDSEGKVRYFHLGFSPGDEEKIEKEIVSLLSE